MVMTERSEKLKAPKSPAQRAAADAIKELRDSGALDGLFAKMDAGTMQLTGESGFVPGLIKAALERQPKRRLRLCRTWSDATRLLEPQTGSRPRNSG